MVEVLRLPCWNGAFVDLELDTRTGSARYLTRIAPRSDAEPVPGFAVIERSLSGRAVPFAVYRAGDATFFVAGSRRWELGRSELAFEHRSLLPWLSRFQVHEAGLVALSFTLYSGSDGVIGWWEPAAAPAGEGMSATIATVGTGNAEARACVTRDATRLAWRRDRAVGVIALPAGGTPLHAAAFHPSGQFLATGAKDGSVATWDVARGEMIAQMRGHRDYIHGMAFSPDGNFLATASADATVRIWETRSPAELAVLTP